MVFDADALRQIFSVQSAAWTFTALIFLFVWRMWNGAPAMFSQWIAYKQAKAAEKAAHWNRLQTEITRLSDAERQCRQDFDKLHSDFIDIKAQLSELRGYQAGYGRAHQEAAAIIAIERQEKPKDKP